jgi:hypothetical protein
MKRGETLRVFDGHGLARLEIEDHLMFGAVILPHAAHVFPERDRIDEGQENGDPDDAIGGVECQPAVEERVVLPQFRHQGQRQELVHEDEERQREEHARRHGELGRLLHWLSLRLSGLDLGFERHVRGEAQRLDPQLHRLVQRAHAAEDRIAVDGVQLRHSGQRHLFGHDFAGGFADRDAVAMGRAHHDALHHSLAAD